MSSMHALVISIAITILSAVGLYASVFMFDKEQRAQWGEVRGPSVVKTPQARLLGPPNALIAMFYYPLIVVAIWGSQVFHLQVLSIAALIGAIAAGLMSAALAFSLLFITKRWCPFCWSAHAINWSLVVLVWLLH